MSEQPVETHVVVDAAAGAAAGGEVVTRGRGRQSEGTTSATSDDLGGRDGGGERLIHFEEWWVRHRAALPALRFEQVGLASAVAAPGVLDALTTADVVVLPPSNPVVSVSTILAVPGVRDALAATPAPVVGVSPIVGGAAVRGMAAQCLATVGVDATAEAVARYLGRRGAAGLDGPGVLDAWLVDDVDTDAAAALRADGWQAAAAPTLMHDVPTTARIAAAALALVGA